MGILTGRWSAYISGAMIALLFLLGLYLLDTPVGMSDAYVILAEYCEDCIHARQVIEPRFFNWQTGFLGGIFLGALLAALIGGQWRLSLFPEDRHHKDWLVSSGVTPFQGLVGGFLVMLGLQLAGDSFIGQWAAALQLSTGAWLFLFEALVAATVTSLLIGCFVGNKEKK